MSDPNSLERVIRNTVIGDRFGSDLGLDSDFLTPTGASGHRHDPYLGFNFTVEIDGLLAGGFSEVSGLQIAIDVQVYREGGENLFEHQLPGPARYPQRLTLKRGLTDRDVFWDWTQQVARGVIVRRNITIALHDESGAPVMLWDCRRAFPVHWSGPDLRADGNAVAFETVELAHHGIARSKGLSMIDTGAQAVAAIRRKL